MLGIISVHDVGKAINMQQVTGQIEGCLAQALGYTLIENFQMQQGHVLTPYFSTYLLPTSLDMPTEIVPVVLELAHPHGPFGARGMAEMPLVPFAPAVATAIQAATGIWLTQLPITPERVLTELKIQASLIRTRDNTSDMESPSPFIREYQTEVGIFYAQTTDNRWPIHLYCPDGRGVRS